MTTDRRADGSDRMQQAAAPTRPAADEGDSLYDAPAFYRQLFDDRQHDLPFYEAAASRAAGPILELGVGTGRVALPLARRGYSVTGVDRAARMVAALRAALEREPAEVAARLSLLVSEVRTISLGRAFALVTMPFNGLAHFHASEDLDALFGVVRAHLEPEGLFAFDVLLPDPQRLAGSSSTVPWFRHPGTGEVCRCDEEVRYDAATRLVTIETRVRFMQVERPDELLTLRLRQFEPHEIERIARRRGFELVERSSLIDATGYLCRLG